MSTHQYRGVVVDKVTKAGVSGLRVEAWDSRGLIKDPIVTADTDADGAFTLQVTDDALTGLFGTRPPVVWFKVVSQTDVKAVTNRSLTWSPRADAAGRIEVRSGTTVVGRNPQVANYSVEGYVFDPDVGPLEGAAVTVIDRNIVLTGGIPSLDEIHHIIASATTDARGHFLTTYNAAALASMTGKTVPDLIVHAVRGSVDVSVNIPRALPKTVVRLVAGSVPYAGPTTFQTLSERAAAIPGISSSVFSSLVGPLADHVANRTGHTVDHIEEFGKAAVLADAYPSVGHEVFFGLIKAGFPGNASDLFCMRLPAMQRGLSRAVDAGHISPNIRTHSTSVMTHLEAAAVSFLATPGGGELPIGELLSLDSAPSTDSKNAFVSLLLNHEGTAEELWSQVEMAVGTTDTPKLRFTVEIAPLVAGHAPLITNIISSREGGTFTQTSDLATKDVAYWIDQLTNHVTGDQFPSGTPGNNPGEKIASFANLIVSNLAFRFRTITLARDNPLLRSFLDDHPTFDFEQHRVSSFVAPLSGVSPTTVTALKALERQHKVSSSTDDIAALQAASYESAASIHASGLENFASKMAAHSSLSIDLVKLIFNSACWVTAASLKVSSLYSPKLEKVLLNALPDRTTGVADLPGVVPDWSSLFGSVDACDCEHCESVYGPAAYLVDMLDFLAQQPGVSGSLRDNLFASRPDLSHLLLSCENAETALPYVDLVLEILEVRAFIDDTLPLPWPSSPASIDTHQSTDELLAQPEVQYPTQYVGCYRALDGAVYPFDVPFNLWQEEARIYLDYLGVHRYDLLLALAPTPPSSAILKAVSVERLELTIPQYDLISGALSGEPASFWGFPNTGTDYSWLDAAAGPPHAHLGWVSVILQRAGITFEQLQELFATQPISGTLAISPATTCDVASMTVDWGADATHASFVGRFLRLLKHVSWSITDLGKIVHFFSGSIDDAALGKIATMRVLSERLKVSATVLLSFWGDLDIYENAAWPSAKSLFRDTFLNARVANPPDSALLGIFNAPSSTPSDTIDEKRGVLLGALRINNQDFRLLTDSVSSTVELGFAATYESTTALRLGVLSRLFRIVSLARALKLSVRNYLVIHTLSGQQPLLGDGGTPGPDDLVSFTALVDKLVAAKASIEEIDFVARDFASPSSNLRPDDNLVNIDSGRWHGDIEDGVKTASDDAAKLTDGDGSRTVALLDVLFPPASGGSPPSADATTVLSFLRDNTDPDDPNPLKQPDRTTQLAAYSLIAPFMETAADAETALVVSASLPAPAAYLVNPADRFNFVVAGLARRVDSSAFVEQWVATTFAIDQGAATSLLTSGALHFGSSVALEAFVPVALATAPAGDREARSHILLRLHKVSLIIKRFKLTVAEVSALFRPSPGTPSPLPWFDLDNFLPFDSAPADPAADARARFAVWMRFIDYANLRDAWPGGVDSLLQVFADAQAATAGVAPSSGLLDEVATGSAWGRADLTALVARFSVLVEQLRDERLLTSFADIFAKLQRLGASAAQAVGWVDLSTAYTSPTNLTDAGPNAFTVARDIKTVARAKHTDAEWADIARPLRDVLREKQRITLVDYLLVKLGMPDANALYEELLLDVQMTPAALTSRIVLAHSSVQQFVEEILLNLKTGLALNQDAARDWRWMKYYRVWEANRKVFLYPENWITPELRDDKTPLFLELESTLLQGPITDATVEDAYRSYLDGLADLASLEIISMHIEKPEASLGFLQPQASIIHVFGRSRGPKKYYHRTQEQGLWSPWELLDLDLDTDHLLPVTLGGLLYLFWPALDTVAMANQDQNAQPSQLSKTETSVRMSFAFRSNGKWIGRGHADSEPLRLGALYPAWALSFTVNPVGADGLIHFDCLTGDLLKPDLTGQRVIARFAFDPADRSITSEIAAQLLLSLRDVSLERPPALIVPASIVLEFKPVPLNYAKLLVPTPDTQFSTGFPVLSAAIMAGLSGNVVSIVPWYQGYRHNHPLSGSDYPLPTSSLYLWLEGDDQSFGARNVLGGTFGTFELITNRSETTKERPYLIFKDDKKRSFFLTLKTRRHVTTSASPSNCVLRYFNPITKTHYEKVYQFEALHHPFVTSFRRELGLGGLDGLLRWADQTNPIQLQETSLVSTYLPNDATVTGPFPKDQVDFTNGSAFGVYNWELFFHAPFLIAKRLSNEGNYEEAQRWFHYIFDPTDGTPPTSGEGPTHFWKVKPLFQNKNLAAIQAELGVPPGVTPGPYAQQVAAWSDPQNSDAKDQLSKEIAAWTNNPFDPDAVARVRVIAYQKLVVMSYINNLIAWGDSLFLQDSIEAINEATQLYVIAQGLLGPRPIFSRPTATPTPFTYADLSTPENVLEAESLAPHPPPPDQDQVYDIYCGARPSNPYNIFKTDKFCVPPNDQLLALWDTVADRLFKIRHSENIAGIVRSLPLFQPPIDPALLIRARAAGVDISSVLSDLNVAAPPYRYTVLFAKANEFVASLTSLGNGLLSAMEKRDAESLSQLRSGHDVANLKAQIDIRKQELNEATVTLGSIQQGRAVTQKRFDFYSQIVKVTPLEDNAFKAGDAAAKLTNSAGLAHASATIAYAIPEFNVGASGIASPVATAALGGDNFGKVAEAFGSVYNLQAARRTHDATRSTTLAQWERRADDWALQADLARFELFQIDSQIAAAEIRVALAQQQLDLITQQRDQAQEVDTFLRDKFTNQELYTWMVGQTSALYFQSYKLAYEMAKRAEKAFQYERGDVDQTYIQFGAWDGVRQGLLAGERLGLDLKRLDAAYYAQNTRELELAKDVSLLKLDPEQYLRLRKLGVAEFRLQEWDFDRDHSTHYLRRVKSASVTVPCVTAPYEGVNGTLELLQGETRKQDGTIAQSRGAIQQIATSQGQADAGLFELNFKDDRFLPFEGMGAQAETGTQWRFTLSQGNQLDFESIDDLVLHLKYTARGNLSRELPTPQTRKRLIRVRYEFPDAWQAFISGSATTLTLALTPDLFPHGRNEALGAAADASTPVVYAQWASGGTPSVTALTGAGDTFTLPTSSIPHLDDLYYWTATAASTWVLDAPATWTITPGDAAHLDEVWLLIPYSLTTS